MSTPDEAMRGGCPSPQSGSPAQSWVQWGAEDYRPSQENERAPPDPWAPADPIEQTAGSRLGFAELISLPIDWEQDTEASQSQSAFFDPWDPQQPICDVRSDKTSDSWEPASLPHFDVHARRDIWFSAVLDSPLVRDARSKAKWIVALAPPIRSSERPRLLRRFAELFTDETSKAFFHSVRQLTEICDDPWLIVAAIEVKMGWEERPEFWCARTRRSVAPSQSAGYSKTFSLRRALRIASKTIRAPESAIDDAWLAEWRRLRWPAPGFWTFADYAELRALAEGPDDWDMIGALQLEESLWSRSNVSPERLVSGKKVATTKGVIALKANVPRTVAESYAAWREKTEQDWTQESQNG